MISVCGGSPRYRGTRDVHHPAQGSAGYSGSRTVVILILGSGFSFHNLRAMLRPDNAQGDSQNIEFENWLIADLIGFKSITKYKVSNRVRRLIEPDKADNVDAINLLKLMGDGSYDKIGDGIRISKNISPQRIAQHSRSFRRCLRVIGDPSFKNQSNRPLK